MVAATRTAAKSATATRRTKPKPKPATATATATAAKPLEPSRQLLGSQRYDGARLVAQLSAPTRQALTQVFGFTRPTKIQAATLAPLLAGRDCFAKAQTGGGKSLAFLVPVVERLAAGPSRRASASASATGGAPLRIGALVVSPARELAEQIGVEARKLLTYHPRLGATVVFGGRPAGAERAALQRAGAGGQTTVLIGTPGRLLDHLENTPGFAAALRRARVLVLDEADTLLDMGFRPALDRIVAALRSGAATASSRQAPRQTLLFSATLPPGVLDVAARVLRPGYDVIDTSGGVDRPRVNPQVVQEMVVVPSTSAVHAVARVLRRCGGATPPLCKAIVFLPTARHTELFAAIFQRAFAASDGPEVLELHSRLAQNRRTAVSDRFRAAAGGVVLFSSDVSARGVDYPGVGLVVQVGLTTTEQYVHRLGRTGRAGRPGAGICIVADYEAALMRADLRELAVPEAGPASALTGGPANGFDGASVRPDADVQRVLDGGHVRPAAEKAYAAWLGFYNGHLRRLKRDKAWLLAEAGTLFRSLGLAQPPALPSKLLRKMGLGGR